MSMESDIKYLWIQGEESHIAITSCPYIRKGNNSVGKVVDKGLKEKGGIEQVLKILATFELVDSL